MKYRKDIQTEAEEFPTEVTEGQNTPPNPEHDSMESAEDEKSEHETGIEAREDFTDVDEILASMSEEQKQYAYRKLMTEMGGMRMTEETEE